MKSFFERIEQLMTALAKDAFENTGVAVRVEAGDHGMILARVMVVSDHVTRVEMKRFTDSLEQVGSGDAWPVFRVMDWEYKERAFFMIMRA